MAAARPDWRVDRHHLDGVGVALGHVSARTRVRAEHEDPHDALVEVHLLGVPHGAEAEPGRVGCGGRHDQQRRGEQQEEPYAAGEPGADRVRAARHHDDPSDSTTSAPSRATSYPNTDQVSCSVLEHQPPASATAAGYRRRRRAPRSGSQRGRSRRRRPSSRPGTTAARPAPVAMTARASSNGGGGEHVDVGGRASSRTAGEGVEGPHEVLARVVAQEGADDVLRQHVADLALQLGPRRLVQRVSRHGRSRPAGRRAPPAPPGSGAGRARAARAPARRSVRPRPQRSRHESRCLTTPLSPARARVMGAIMTDGSTAAASTRRHRVRRAAGRTPRRLSRAG